MNDSYLSSFERENFDTSSFPMCVNAKKIYLLLEMGCSEIELALGFGVGGTRNQSLTPLISGPCKPELGLAIFETRLYLGLREAQNIFIWAKLAGAN